VLKVLEAKGITPASVTYLAGAAETQAELLSNPDAIVVTADPAVTAAKIKNEKVQVISVQQMLKEALDMDGYTQAGLFVRKETAEERPEEVKAYLEAVRESADKAASDTAAVAEAAVALEILPNAKVAMAAIPGCSIRYMAAQDAKELVEKTAALDIAQFGGEVPADEFYY
jgi:NitT/TauT family transport system substrate-binding protein